jgi:ligand-binding sensor domain-containing protein/signal transduction histidine kinase
MLEGRTLINLNIKALFFAAVFLVSSQVKAQIKHYQHFDVSNGLGSNYITDVASGPDGYIWLTSNGAGISRYDGLLFEHFTDLPVLGDLYFHSIAIGDSVIWFGGENSLVSFQQGKFERFSLPGVGAISKIVEATNDYLFCIGTRKSILFSRKDKKVSDNIPAGVRFHDGIVAAGILYASSSAGLWTLSNQSWEKQQGASDIKPQNCSEILLMETGNLLLVDRDQGLLSYGTDGLVKVLISPTDFPADKITFLKEGGVGELFFGTKDQGVLIFQQLDSLWQQLDPERLRFDHITNLVFDQWENAWVATAGGGLTKFSTQGFVLRNWPELSGRYIQSIQQANDTIFIKYRGGVVDYLPPHASRPVKYISTLKEAKIAIRDFATSTNRIYGTENGLYYRKDSVVGAMDFSQEILAIKEIDSLKALVATPTDVWRVSVSGKDSIGLPIFDYQEVLSVPVAKMVADRYNQIWYFSDNQLGILGSGHRVLNGIRPYALVHFQARSMFLGTRDGLFVVRDLTDSLKLSAVRFDQEQISHIVALACDQEGKLWIATRNEILQTVISSDLQGTILKRYNDETGLPRLEIGQNSLAINRQNHVFVGTSAGLLEILPEAQTRAAHGPILTLASVEIGDKIYSGLNPATFASLGGIDPKNRSLSFSFKAIDQKSPAAVHYFYQLDNSFNEWSLSKTGGEFNFLSLPLGRHKLLVKAVNHEGLESATQQIAFRILTPFYLSWWFLAAIVLLFLGLVYLLYSWALARRLGESARRAETLQLQNRMLRLEQDARRLQMNPHFIFNALQSIQQKITAGAREQARIDLQAFAKMMRGFLDHSRREKISLEEEIEMLSLYLQVEQELKNGAFNFEIELSDKIDPSFVDLPPMLIQPFVENAIKHGLPKNNLPGLVYIKFDLKGRCLTCTVSDNGAGMQRDIADEVQNKSAGIDITKKRLETFFKDKTITPLTFEQRRDKQGAVCGTIVTIVLPAEV